MSSIISRLFPTTSPPEPLKPGLYHWMTPGDAPLQYRLHLRVEKDGSGILIANAATVLHLNPTATAHALQIIEGASAEEAATAIAARYRVSRRQALSDHQELRDKIHTLATIPDVDPVVFLGMDRAEPFAQRPSAPYRLDLALTFRCDASGVMDPLARRRVDRELTTSEWQQILSTLWDAGVPHVIFTGGEPTLRDDLRDLIAHAESLGQVTGLLTNGVRLADQAYLDSLSMAGLDHILLTLLKGEPASQRGLSNALSSDIFTAVHLTITPDTIEDVGVLLKELLEKGVSAVSLSASAQTDSLANALVDAREHAANLGLDLIWNIPAPYSPINPIALELEAPPVGAGRAWLYVEPDGDVLPAQGVDQVLGNLVSDAWSDIWSEESGQETE
jgi:MoaA/NifB/PqqE/SkfB family radical SAM enzyme